LGIDVQVWGGAAFDWTDAEGKFVAGLKEEGCNVLEKNDESDLYADRSSANVEPTPSLC